MKKAVVHFVSLMGLTTVGMAAASNNNMAVSDQSASNASGIYVDGNVGYGKVNRFKYPGQGISNFSNSGFTWRTDLGYQFNRYVALETGYTRFADVKASQGNFSETLKNYGIDLLVKGILPINNQWNVFAKAGAVYLHTKQTASNIGNYITYFNSASGAATDDQYGPELALGTSYYLTKHVDVSLQGVAMFAGGTDVSTYAGYAGLGYKFNA